MAEPLPLQPDPYLPPGSERRASIRYLCKPEVLHATVDGDPWMARVRNISTGGISLIISRSFEPGSVIDVHLMNTRRKTSRQLDVKVVYAVEYPDGEWILGGEFVHRLSGDDLKALL
jgi:hypothetical protein